MGRRKVRAAVQPSKSKAGGLIQTSESEFGFLSRRRARVVRAPVLFDVTAAGLLSDSEKTEVL